MQQAMVSLRLQSPPLSPLENGEARGNPKNMSSSTPVLTQEAPKSRVSKVSRVQRVFFGGGVVDEQGLFVKVSFFGERGDPLGWEGWKEVAAFTQHWTIHFLIVAGVILRIHGPDSCGCPWLLWMFSKHCVFSGRWKGSFFSLAGWAAVDGEEKFGKAQFQ